MKKEIGNKVRLGMFVSAAIAFLIIGIYFIGQKQRIFAQTFKVRVIFKDVNGLQIGNNVRFSGINIGNVDKIKIISDTTVEVGLILDKNVKKFIKKDAQAGVGSEGLMGDKLVNISSGSEGGPEIGNNDYIQAIDGNDIDAIMKQVRITAKNAAQISDDLADITGNIRQGRGTIGKLFSDTVMARNLGQTMVNVKEGTAGLKEDIVAAQHNILLRGYFKKKEKEKEKEAKQQNSTNQ
jgi:phospholipid/cholesterol/gamma-HCH transport system substrate-binding protein